MTYPHRTLDPADASVLLSVRGVPSWGAGLIGLIFGIGALLAGYTNGQYSINWLFGLVFVAGIVLATLAVRRGSLFTAMVQAPILIALLVFIAFRLLGSAKLFTVASELVAAFPIMAIATGAAVLLALVRIIAQPLRRAGGDRGTVDSSPGFDGAEDYHAAY